ncbi:sigma-70 family RNA polymerase sigma factor [Paenibacillus sp. BK033]|uniref:sigma-70 family RNA polymerase sigma factor n=1 Tax=unclassified Paenibacillus TaxID=185978 RepID=UPI0010480660|nr:sigma-70 family RNA polymerase sigma factor [Paenibacillus sp. BK033]NIK69471.1 RNA polymerase sigma-70 factor (ECF subfamily) [Paenibacillus sp. BK720]TCM95649.1 RNA polymerase sigma (SigV) subunit [Paenibacillus sp. BK033]
MRGIIDLVKMAQHGDESAYLKLFQQYEEDLYRAAYVHVGNEEDALDVMQETAYRSFKGIRKLKEPAYFKTWLIKIAISCSIDLLRKRKRQMQWRPEYLESITVSDEEDFTLSITLKELVEALEPEEKSVVILRYYYDLTIREVTEVLDIPLGTGKTLLYRALKKLRKRVEEDGDYGYGLR